MSETVDAAWEALSVAIGTTEQAKAIVPKHRPLIEAAIRAESDYNLDDLLLRRDQLLRESDERVAALREALERIAVGCEASEWANDKVNVWDACLDPEYIEGEPTVRCSGCEAHAALLSDAAPEDA